VNLRVLALSDSHPVGSGSFIHLRFAPVYDVTFHDVVYVEQMTSSFYFEEYLDTYRYAVAFDLLSRAALGVAESMDRISQIAAEVWG
jgi:hypothetical protein